MLNRLQSREETFFKEGGVDLPENEEREQLLEVRNRHAYIFNFVLALVLSFVRSSDILSGSWLLLASSAPPWQGAARRLG